MVCRDARVNFLSKEKRKRWCVDYLLSRYFGVFAKNRMFVQ